MKQRKIKFIAILILITIILLVGARYTYLKLNDSDREDMNQDLGSVERETEFWNDISKNFNN